VVLENHKEVTAVVIRYCSAVLSTAYILRTCPSTNGSRQHIQHQRGVACTAQTITMRRSIRKRSKIVPKADKKAQDNLTPRKSIHALQSPFAELFRQDYGFFSTCSLTRSLHHALLLLRATPHRTESSELKVFIVLLLKLPFGISLLAYSPSSNRDCAI